MISLNGCSQTNPGKQEAPKSMAHIGGTCEGCEAIFESSIALEELNNVDTLPDFDEAGPKIEISGIIYQADGRTPAQNVVLYVYHTDQQGNYSTKGSETGWGKRHGYIRGWVKTNEDGAYKFFTLVPASYPNSKNPRHIHCTIKEKDKNEYWIDEYLFDDDPYLTADKRNISNSRGGNGILKAMSKDGMLSATRNIILGKNVPGYPLTKAGKD
ncbi:MAG: intradiol ring-cleavage dioxygenase [Ferruginibacter sp.]|nr:intradiol ring-cleavage dioxygenase [Ferruginibacter sp.]